jgi:nucleoside-diphosphate-sugar epimerase
MRVIVFGASGATGRQLVGQALADGHQVTAFVRRVSRLDIRSGQLTVVWETSRRRRLWPLRLKISDKTYVRKTPAVMY